MKRFLLFTLYLFFFFSVKGQRNYEEAMKLGDDALKKQKFKKAINQYFAAQAFDPSKNGQVKTKINKVFDAIELLRKQGQDSWSNFLISKAESVVEKDPTLALRLAEQAWLANKNDEIKKAGSKIYVENCFYKIIGQNNIGINMAVFSPDRKTVLTSSGDIFFKPIDKNNTPRLWNLEEGIIREFGDYSSVVSTIAFSADGEKIFICYYDGSARLWGKDGKMLKQFENNSSWITSAAFSPDGKLIVTSPGNFSPNNFNDSTTLWDKDGKVIRKFGETGLGSSSMVAFSPDGRYFLVGGDSSAILRDLDGNVQTVFKGYAASISAVAFSPDGKLVLMGYREDATARIWDFEGNMKKEFKGHKNWISSVAFSPDGKQILTGSMDKKAILWDINGNLKKELRGHTGSISSVAFSLDGKTILTGSTDGTIRSWGLGAVLKRDFSSEFNFAIVNHGKLTTDEKSILTWSGNELLAWWEVEMTLDDFLRSNKIEQLTEEQKKQYGIK